MDKRLSQYTPNRRDFLKSTVALAAIGGMTGLLRSEVKAAAIDDFRSANIDWQAFKGETLHVGAMEHPWTQAVEPIIPIFQELTGIKVVLNKQSEAEYVSELPIKFGSKFAKPDVVMVHALGQFISAGWLEPLEDFYADKAIFDAAWYDEGDLFAMAKNFPIWSDGVRYTQSITAEAQTLFANRSAMNEAGVTMPKTFDQLYDTALKVHSAMRAGIALRSKADGSAGTWPCGGFVFSYGGEVIANDGSCVLDSDEAIAAVEMYGRLLKDAGPLGVGNYHWYEVLNDFKSGAAVFAMDSSTFAPDIINPKTSSVAADALFGAMPQAGSKPPKANIWTWQAGINRNSNQKKAAFLFLSFVNSKPGSLLTSANGLPTTRNTAWKSKSFRKAFGEPAVDAALFNLNSGDAEIFKKCWFHPKAAQILDSWGIGINEVATGVKDAKTAMTEATAKINDVLEG